MASPPNEDTPESLPIRILKGLWSVFQWPLYPVLILFPPTSTAISVYKIVKAEGIRMKLFHTVFLLLQIAGILAVYFWEPFASLWALDAFINLGLINVGTGALLSFQNWLVLSSTYNIVLITARLAIDLCIPKEGDDVPDVWPRERPQETTPGSKTDEIKSPSPTNELRQKDAFRPENGDKKETIHDEQLARKIWEESKGVADASIQNRRLKKIRYHLRLEDSLPLSPEEEAKEEPNSDSEPSDVDELEEESGLTSEHEEDDGIVSSLEGEGDDPTSTPSTSQVEENGESYPSEEVKKDISSAELSILCRFIKESDQPTGKISTIRVSYLSQVIEYVKPTQHHNIDLAPFIVSASFSSEEIIQAIAKEISKQDEVSVSPSNITHKVQSDGKLYVTISPPSWCAYRMYIYGSENYTPDSTFASDNPKKDWENKMLDQFETSALSGNKELKEAPKPLPQVKEPEHGPLKSLPAALKREGNIARSEVITIPKSSTVPPTAPSSVFLTDSVFLPLPASPPRRPSQIGTPKRAAPASSNVFARLSGNRGRPRQT